jgi:hypothetical protein
MIPNMVDAYSISMRHGEKVRKIIRHAIFSGTLGTELLMRSSRLLTAALSTACAATAGLVGDS